MDAVPYLLVRPGGDPLQVQAVWVNAGGIYTLWWGDDTPGDVAVLPQRPLRHRYHTAGIYQLLARDVHGRVIGTQITIPLTAKEHR